MSKTVIHRDGRIEVFQTEKIIDAIKYLFEGNKIIDPFMMMFKVIKNFELKLPDQVSKKPSTKNFNRFLSIFIMVSNKIFLTQGSLSTI